MKRRIATLWLEIWLPALLIAAWWWMSRGSTSLYFPPLSKIMDSFRSLWLFQRVPTDVWPSVRSLFIGLVISLVVGIAGGLLLGLIDSLRKAVNPVLQFIWALPKIAALPAVIVIFGIGSTTTVVLVVLGALWPILLNTMEGVRGVDPAALATTLTYRVRWRDRLLRVYLPGASPLIMAGIRTSLQIAITLVIISEMVASTRGIGFFVLQAQQGFAIADMWSGVILLGIIGYVLNLALRVADHWVLRWHHGRQLGQSERLSR